MADIIRLEEAKRPEFTKGQEGFCENLIGMGLTRLSIIALVLGKSTGQLDHAEVGAGQRLIERKMKELGYGVMDARRANTPFMANAVRAAAGKHRLKLKLA